RTFQRQRNGNTRNDDQQRQAKRAGVVLSILWRLLHAHPVQNKYDLATRYGTVYPTRRIYAGGNEIYQFTNGLDVAAVGWHLPVEDYRWRHHLEHTGAG